MKDELQQNPPSEQDDLNQLHPFGGPFYEYGPPQQTPPVQMNNRGNTPHPVFDTPVQTPPYFSPQIQTPIPQPQRGNFWLYAAISIVLCAVIVLGTYLFSSTRPATTQATPTAVVPQATTASTPAQPTSVHTASVPVPTDAFAKAKCPFTPDKSLKEGEDIQCGFVTVPEDHTKPEGKKIKLAVAIFKPTTANPPAEPLLQLHGGPGGDLLKNWAPYVGASNLESFTHGHTLIMFDQRGSGFSTPSLNCPEVDILTKETQDENMNPEVGQASYLATMSTCHARLAQEGNNVGAYTTISNAADVHDLIQALGYKQAKLYGTSYGTLLALTVMRLSPEVVHSVILDSTVPLQRNFYKEWAFLTQHSLDTLFKGCAASADCKQQYPDLENIFYKLVTRLNQQPVTFEEQEYGPVLLTGDDFADWIFSAMYLTSFIPRLPQVITQVDQGNYSFLERNYGFLMLDTDGSEGKYYSVRCGENMAFTTREELEATAQLVRPELRASMLGGINYSIAVCDLWNDQKVPDEQKQPFESAIPTLILAGEYDPITPPVNGEMVHQSLKNSYFFTFPGVGHGASRSSSCATSIFNNFLQQPTVAPNGNCISNLKPPAFV